jgi:16S rRNA (cytosine1402-N4)-methyltransferase
VNSASYGSAELVHVPVLLEETLRLLDVKEDGIYVDATVGLGGHSEAILSRLSRGGRLIGIDRDEEAITHARERLGNTRVHIEKGTFSQLETVLRKVNVEKTNGVFFDLGVSMLQLKKPSRGFSFLSHEHLDMRMDMAQGLTAWDIVNTYPEDAIEKILREYGEEPFARRITKAVALRRKSKPIDTCAELARLVSEVCRRRGRTHPATKTFQALRIEVNQELDELRKGLEVALNVLATGGRLCVISYHSLEDRTAKCFFREKAKEGAITILTKKPLSPQDSEKRLNPSSRSAKLRGAKKK